MSRSAAISSLERGAQLDALEAARFDLVLVGGGITGAGIALEAARRGLSVALLEASDYAAGTSSRSSKLIHGGLRYLAMGDVALVRETALERKQIHRIAPHLAEPRWMVLPTRSRAGLMKFRVGITTYEKLGAVEEQDVHQNWSADDLEREEPLLDRDRYPYACAYREYLTDDARLVLANLRGAVQHGAHVVNYTRVTGFLREGDRIAGVVGRCAETEREVRVRARCVVNAAGPWVEEVRRLDEPEAAPWLHISKGIHVQIPRERLPVRHLLMVQTNDRRTVFLVPRGNVTYVGTTDTTYEPGAELWPRITQADVEYLLEPLPRYLRIEPVQPDELVGTWAGLRPLVAEPGKAPQELSRKDEVSIGSSGLISIAGGKLTGYRPMAWGVLEKVASVLSQSLPEVADDEVLPGGDFDGDLDRLAEKLVSATGAPPEAARPLARLYGTEAARVLELGAEPLVPGNRLFAGEVDWAVREEGALTVEDVLYRRNRSAYWAPSVAQAAVAPVARRMAELLGWTPEREERECGAARTRMLADLSFQAGA